VDPVSDTTSGDVIGWAIRGEARLAEDRWQQRLEEIHLANEDRYTS